MEVFMNLHIVRAAFHKMFVRIVFYSLCLFACHRSPCTTFLSQFADQCLSVHCISNLITKIQFIVLQSTDQTRAGTQCLFTS